MTRNVGPIDRAARLLLGVALLGWFSVLESPWRYLTLVGLILLATAVTAACPVYGALGWSTRMKSRLEDPDPAAEAEGSEGLSSERKTGERSDQDSTWPPEKPPPWRPSDRQ